MEKEIGWTDEDRQTDNQIDRKGCWIDGQKDNQIDREGDWRDRKTEKRTDR